MNVSTVVEGTKSKANAAFEGAKAIAAKPTVREVGKAVGIGVIAGVVASGIVYLTTN